MENIVGDIDPDIGILIESFHFKNNKIVNNKLLAIQNKETKYAPASLCKLLTIFLIWEKAKDLNLDKTFVRVPTSVLSGSSEAFQIFKEGDFVNLQTLIKATLIMSSNEAAYTLADWHSGNQNAFVERMNANATWLGLKSTKFTSSHGLDRQAYTTVEDMSVLAKEFIQQCTPLLDYSSQGSFNYSNKEWFSSNRLLPSYSEIKGLKTGFLGGIGANLINYWIYDNAHYLCIILEAETGKLRYEIAEKVLLKSRTYNNKLIRLKLL